MQQRMEVKFDKSKVHLQEKNEGGVFYLIRVRYNFKKNKRIPSNMCLVGYGYSILILTPLSQEARSKLREENDILQRHEIHHEHYTLIVI